MRNAEKEVLLEIVCEWHIMRLSTNNTCKPMIIVTCKLVILLLLTVFNTLIGCSLIISTEHLVEEITGPLVQIVNKV